MLALLPWALATALKRDLAIDLSWLLSASAGNSPTADNNNNNTNSCPHYFSYYCNDQCLQNAERDHKHEHEDEDEDEEAHAASPGKHAVNDYDYFNRSIEYGHVFSDDDDEDNEEDEDNRTVVTLTSSEPSAWFDADDGLASLEMLLNHPQIVETLIQRAPRLRFLCTRTYYHSLKALPVSFLNTHHTRRLTLEPPATDTLWIGDIGNVLTHTPFLTTLHLAGSSAAVSNLLAKILMDACPLLTDLSVSTSDAITHGFLRRLRLAHLASLSLKDLPGLPAQTALVIALENHPQLRSLAIINLPAVASPDDSFIVEDQAQPHTALRILDVSNSAIPTPLLPLLTPNLTSLAMRSMPWQINLPPIVLALPQLTRVDVRGSRGNTSGAAVRAGVVVLDGMPAAGDTARAPTSKSGVPLTTRLVRAFSM
ncbi:hypothetical protein HDU87_005565 [Geranomyces variabilis]|uniref:Uncharacterized protein n=1 Tax=Geranomyces variabilis TaxID=109894 RepID=A0AAD5TGN2_9FUNG|nr:hypothetical protein HDU87_005565 [Geranomyces variabilis]